MRDVFNLQYNGKLFSTQTLNIYYNTPKTPRTVNKKLIVKVRATLSYTNLFTSLKVINELTHCHIAMVPDTTAFWFSPSLDSHDHFFLGLHLFPQPSLSSSLRAHLLCSLSSLEMLLFLRVLSLIFLFYKWSVNNRTHTHGSKQHLGNILHVTPKSISATQTSPWYSRLLHSTES